MLFQSVMDQFTRDIVLRTVVNSITASTTITARTIAIGSPVILETNTNSLPSTASNSSLVNPFWPMTTVQNFVNRPATSTSLVNNLLVGLLWSADNTNVAGGPQTYLEGEQAGLALAYGAYVGAPVIQGTTAIAVGNVMAPESSQALIYASGPVTAAATGTAAHVEAPAIGGLIISMQALASSSATVAATLTVHCRCM